MQSKLCDDNIQKNGTDRTDNKRKEEIRNAYIVVVRKLERERLDEVYVRKWMNSMKMELIQILCGCGQDEDG
jgi:hypothetical protein